MQTIGQANEEANFLCHVGPDAIRRGYFEVNQATTLPDGWVHEKTVPHAIIVQAVHGWYEVDRDQQHEVINPGEVFLSSPHVPLRFTHHGDPDHAMLMAARWVHCQFSLNYCVEITALLDLPIKLVGEPANTIGKTIGDLQALRLSDQSPLTKLIEWNSLSYRLLALLTKVTAWKRDVHSVVEQSSRLADVFEYIHTHISEPISTQDLANVGHLSVSRFHEVFRSLTGQSPMTYLKTVRLNEASYRLVETDETVATIAYSTGFANPYHFSRTFRQHFHSSPSQYRHNQRLLTQFE